MNTTDPTHKDVEKIFALLTHAICAATDARLVLQSLMANLEAMQQGGHSSAAIDVAGHAMLLAASSVTLKQNPDDPDMRALYQELRSAQRH